MKLKRYFITLILLLFVGCTTIPLTTPDPETGVPIPVLDDEGNPVMVKTLTPEAKVAVEAIVPVVKPFIPLPAQGVLLGLSTLFALLKKK